MRTHSRIYINMTYQVFIQRNSRAHRTFASLFSFLRLLRILWTEFIEILGMDHHMRPIQIHYIHIRRGTIATIVIFLVIDSLEFPGHEKAVNFDARDVQAFELECEIFVATEDDHFAKETLVLEIVEC